MNIRRQGINIYPDKAGRLVDPLIDSGNLCRKDREPRDEPCDRDLPNNPGRIIYLYRRLNDRRNFIGRGRLRACSADDRGRRRGLK
jgi:hypothetical protein